MKLLVGFARISVGFLFIFSGFIKLNDPIGFAYKLEEYFSPGVLGLEFLTPFALVIALSLVIFELVLGIMLLIGYLPKFTTWCLLLMIVFFTFLTFYSAYFNKVTDCGCFGDAIPLTPWESFTKDIILLVLIILLFVKRELITPLFKRSSHKWIIFTSFLLCFAFAYYVLMHLPLMDFRAYKIGVNIEEGMSVPEGAPEAVYDYHWKFIIDGEEKIITTQGNFPQVQGEFIDVTTDLVQEGYLPPIHDFSMERNGQDYTQELLDEEKLIMIVAYDLRKSEEKGLREIAALAEKAKAKGYRVIGLSASGEDQKALIKETYGFEFPFYFSDATTLKTIVRSNPGVVKLEQGTILDKLHWNDVEELEL